MEWHPCMVYLPTWMVFNGFSCRQIYQSHGSYGSWNRPVFLQLGPEISPSCAIMRMIEFLGPFFDLRNLRYRCNRQQEQTKNKELFSCSWIFSLPTSGQSTIFELDQLKIQASPSTDQANSTRLSVILLRQGLLLSAFFCQRKKHPGRNKESKSSI